MLTRRALLRTTSLSALTALFPIAPLLAASPSKWPLPPRVAEDPQIVGNFGHTRTDNYAWLKPKDWFAVLRDPANIDAPIKAVIDAEWEYSAAMLAPTAPLQAALSQRAATVAANNVMTLELDYGGFRYFDRPVSGSPHRQYLRRRIAGGDEQLILDVSRRAAGHGFFALGYAGVLRSPDQRLIGWAEDLTGSGIFRIRVQDTATRRMLVDDLDETHGEFAFDASGRYLFWVGRGPKGHPDSVWRREIASGHDVKIHTEDDAGFFIDIRTLASGAFVSIRLFNGAQDETRLIPASDPTAVPIVVEPRSPDLRYTVEHWNDRLLILTDADGAVDMKIMTAPIATPGRAYWTEWVPHRAGRYIVALHPFRDNLIREEWRDANPCLVVMHAGGVEHEVPLGQQAYAIEVPPRQDWKASEFVFVSQTPRVPPQQRRFIFATGGLEIDVVRSSAAYDPDRYEVLHLDAPTADGVRVPITLLRRKGRHDPRAPLLLYGYGSYGFSAKAEFDASAIALVDQGWSYAIAHVRGGSEKGTLWWRSVLTTGKKKTFSDFIACAEYLIERRYTAKKRIVAHGFSAGGLLMGAVFWMRPDLWAGLIARAPFVDPLNDMDGFESHPLGRSALPIWGDPRLPAEYEYMRSYAPYDNLEPAPYPALLVTGSLTDDRVSFTDPLKFAVKARALTTAADPIMVQITPAGGHGGTPGDAASLERNALFHAFAIWAVDRRWGDVPQR